MRLGLGNIGYARISARHSAKNKGTNHGNPPNPVTG